MYASGPVGNVLAKLRAEAQAKVNQQRSLSHAAPYKDKIAPANPKKALLALNAAPKPVKKARMAVAVDEAEEDDEEDADFEEPADHESEEEPAVAAEQSSSAESSDAGEDIRNALDENSANEDSSYEDLVIEPPKEKLYHGFTRSQILRAWHDKVSEVPPKAKYDTDTTSDVLKRAAKYLLQFKLLRVSRRERPRRAAGTKRRLVQSSSSSSSSPEAPKPSRRLNMHAVADSESPPPRVPQSHAAEPPRAPRKGKKPAKAAPETLAQVVERLKDDPEFPLVLSKIPQRLKAEYKALLRDAVLTGAALPGIIKQSELDLLQAQLQAAMATLAQIQAAQTVSAAVVSALPAAAAAVSSPSGDQYLATMDEDGPVLRMGL